MNKMNAFLILYFIACVGCVSNPRVKADDAATGVETSLKQDSSGRNGGSVAAIPAGARILMDVYPDAGMKYKDGYIVFPDGERILYDDGKKKSFTVMLDNSDVEDMFGMRYDTASSKPGYLSDAGRSRCEALFKKMYGKSASEVSSRMETVDWFGQKIKFTKVNGASRQLRKVVAELKTKPHLAKYLKPASTFYWRNVRGAKRMSAHSYGIAIDINVKMSDYWLWANKGKGETAKISYKNRIPLELVRVFEKHGFVWGGRWYHYDTMHFEYRPEQLANKV
ncbi:M15 family metallopeptidase [Xylanibacter caecicola]|uniref:M15 family metallopeptidase n=1 Tax=Xylanibacter caecicola TaxID=2736294 RepID=UPI0025869C8A|nr:M15 family metallopeptidase [Xylanibacter caecicola]